MRDGVQLVCTHLALAAVAPGANGACCNENSRGAAPLAAPCLLGGLWAGGLHWALLGGGVALDLLK